MEDSIRLFIVGPLETNCYAYISQGECMVVDPGASGAAIAQELSDVKVTTIVCTHGHGDHVGGVAALKEATGAKYLIHAVDDEVARVAGEPNYLGMVFEENAPEPDGYLSEGMQIEVGSAVFTVMETPGHSPGSVCLAGSGSAADVVFTGDTLFAGGHGRTDFVGGDEAAMAASLARLKREIPPETAILTGHEGTTTMERELAYNPFLR